jgi:hypothetical protein
MNKLGAVIIFFAVLAACSHEKQQFTSTEKQFIRICEVNNSSVGIWNSPACQECMQRVVKDTVRAMSDAEQDEFVLFQNSCPSHFSECTHEGESYADCACYARLEASETEGCQQHVIFVATKETALCLKQCTMTPR